MVPFKTRPCIEYGYEMQIYFLYFLFLLRQMQRQNLIKNFPEHIKDSVDHLYHTILYFIDNVNLYISRVDRY